MDKCIDHPENMAVEACVICDEYICGLHDISRCERHEEEKNLTNLPIKIFFVVFSIAIVFVIMTAISAFIDTINIIGNAEEGDVITVDSEVVTLTEAVDIPNLRVIITIFFVVSLAILGTFGFIIYRLTRSTKDDDYSFLGERSSPSKTAGKELRTYFCQNCGEKLTMQDLECTGCGKSTDDERNLLR